MLSKRLIGVVTVCNGWAVQSFGFRRYLPLGRPECMVENLDRWGADEILVQVIDRSAGDRGPDFDLLARLGRLGLKTPLIYGGGVASADHAVRAIQYGADRLIIDQVLHRAPHEVRRMSALLGAQGLIAAVPVSFSDSMSRYNYPTQQCLPFGDGVPALIAERVISELLLIDWKNEGALTGFEPVRLDKLPFPKVPLILFGGFSNPVVTSCFLQHPAVAAVGVGNLFAYQEHAYQTYKRAIASAAIRLPMYAGPSPGELY